MSGPMSGLAQQAVTLPGIGTVNFGDLQKNYDKWLHAQHPALECSIVGLTASFQGVIIGYLLGSLSTMDPTAGAPVVPGAPPSPFTALKSQGGPWVQARNLGVLTGVQAGLSLAIKKARNGKEDVWGAMGASFGSGVAYSLISGAPNAAQAAVTTGAAFALFNGLFYKIGKAFAPDPQAEAQYERVAFMLQSLGLPKYADNLKKGQLNDSTIMLWNDNALAEVRIPPGPRLLILHHVDSFRQNPSNVLKLALDPYPKAARPPAAAPRS